MVGKRHASGEITAKLAHANELAAKGKTQREISKALGVSIMTYHRWKKMLNSAEGSDEHNRRSEAEAQLQTLNDASSTEII
jgi:putative transposase